MEEKTGLALAAVGGIAAVEGLFIYNALSYTCQVPFKVEQFWAHETCMGPCGPFSRVNMFSSDYIYQVYIKLSEPVNGYGIVYITIDNNIHAAPIDIVNGEGTATFDEDNALFNHIYFYYLVMNIDGKTYKYDGKTLTCTNESAEFPYKATLTASSNAIDLCNPYNTLNLTVCVTPKTFKSGVVIGIGSIDPNNNCASIGYAEGNFYNLPCITENQTYQRFVYVTGNNNITYEIYTNPVTVSVTKPKQ